MRTVFIVFVLVVTFLLGALAYAALEDFRNKEAIINHSEIPIK